MAGLPSALAEALSDRYTIERELGQGGMATVYLAEDLKHHRKVALKVLRPDLAATIGPERFFREIEVAARLQHPHILPLHDSGEARGFLYYVMPFVDGENLRGRLTRHGELPIHDAVKLLTEVADAMAYAHAQGVVHRDIKPDNVLLSGRHALVTDFGIAKAVSEATGRQILTTAGIALGTPAYMAPEQATADPQLDYRVDIYALGAMGYELLAGRPPFTGLSSQEVLAAHVTQQPQSISTLRPAVPATLAAIIMKCLAKRPADRWQSAEELLHQFEAVATPSGGTQPVLPTVSTQSSATVASRASGFGGPGRRWLRPALIAAAAIALVLGGIYLGGTKGRAPAAATEADVKMLAVLPFKNLGASEDQYFADGLTEEITSRLATVKGLGVISRTSADQYRSTTKALREIGRELGAGYVLEGGVRWEKRAGAPSRVRVTPQLIRVSDDRHLWADRYDAELADIFGVQGNIAEKVMAALNVALGDSGRAAMADRPTAVPEAYDFYLRGLEYERVRDRADEQQLALRFFQKAAALDPRFALALARISKIHSFSYWTYRDRTDSRLALAKATADSALRLSADLPEGHLALAYYHYWGHLDYDQALKELAAAQAGRPNDSEVLYATGLVQRRQGRWAEAMANFTRAAELDPRSSERNNELELTGFVTRDWPVVQVAEERLLAFHPDESDTHILNAGIALFARGDSAAAAAALRAGMAQSDSLEVLASFPAFLLEADPALGPAFGRISLATFQGDSARYFAWRAGFEHRRGDVAAERRYSDSLRANVEPKTKLRPSDPNYHSQLAAAYAGLGRSAEAVGEARKALELVPLSRDALDHTIRAYELASMLARTGQHDAALDQIQYLTTIPSWYSANGYRYLPDWGPLRSNPRFQRLVAGMK